AAPTVKATAGAMTTSTLVPTTPPLDAVDSNLATRWSANGDGQSLTYDLDSVQTVAHVKLAHFRGDQRVATFDLQLSSDGSSWTTPLAGARSSGTTAGLETFDLPDTEARFVRYVGHGNSENAWASVTEMEVHVLAADAAHVQLGADGRLVYLPFANGDRIPDFSFAGYAGGGGAPPDVPPRAPGRPLAGGDGAPVPAARAPRTALAPEPPRVPAARL